MRHVSFVFFRRPLARTYHSKQVTPTKAAWFEVAMERVSVLTRSVMGPPGHRLLWSGVLPEPCSKNCVHPLFVPHPSA